MKLRNKKTGKIVDTLCSDDITKGISFGIDYHDGNPTMAYYNSLSELNEEWEDAPEEVKKVWFIDADGELDSCTHECEYDECGLIAGGMKFIGNYFETKEEAEKAVEKLKAFKRLKDKGFRFIGKTYETDKRFGSIFYKVDDDTYSEDIIDDLDLLFGGEE